MRNQTLTVLDTHPVMLLTILPGIKLIEEWPEGEEAMRQTLDTHPEPLFFVSDIRQLKLSFDDLISAASLGSRGRDPIWHHPKMRSVYFITDSSLVKMAAAGLKTPAFGNVDVRVFGTLEEVLADIERVMVAA